MELFDSHAHYNDEKFDEDRQEILCKIKEAGITKIIIAGYDLVGSKKAVQIAEENEWIYATCGISPNDIVDNMEEEINQIKNIAKSSKKVVAIGEIGLDYYWNNENKDIQKNFFKTQIKLANELDLPIVIHSRDAYIDTIKVLKEIPCKRKGVFHCCQQNMELIKDALDLDYYISFAGPITFKNSKNASEIIKQVPLNKMFIEHLQEDFTHSISFETSFYVLIWFTYYRRGNSGRQDWKTYSRSDN